jgi:20S proteasome alpha/beta subunit
MTTIAYKDGVIAFDSRLSEEDLIISDSYTKHYIDDFNHIFFSGTVVLVPVLVEMFGGPLLAQAPGEIEALVWNGKELYWSGINDGYYFNMNIKLDTPFAIGSGKIFAYTAFDMGADAVKAVEMAAKRDKNTGGVIHSFRL